MADQRSNNHQWRQTYTSAPYTNPFINSSYEMSDGDSPHHQDHVASAYDATSPFFHHHHPADPAHGHQFTQVAVLSSHHPTLSTIPPAYPTLSLSNPFTAPSDVLLGFQPPAQVVADQLAAADSSPLAGLTARPQRTDTYRATYRPLEAGENLFDPEMDSARRNAIVGGFVAGDGRGTPEGEEVDSEVERYFGGKDEGGEEGKEGGKGNGGKKKTKRGRRGGKRAKKFGKGGGGGGNGGFGGGFGGPPGMGGAGAWAVC